MNSCEAELSGGCKSNQITNETPCLKSGIIYKEGKRLVSSKRNQKCHFKRKLFDSIENKDNNSDIKETRKNKSSSTERTQKKEVPSTDRKVSPLSERQQIALLLRLTANETSPDLKIKSPSRKSLVCTSNDKWKKVNKRNERGETPLHCAAIKGDINRVKKLLRQGAEVNAKDFAGWTPLHEACNHGWQQVAKSLIQAGADINAKGLDDITPLHDATGNGHIKLIELLLRHGADPLQRNRYWKTPIDTAQSDVVLKILNISSRYTNYIGERRKENCSSFTVSRQRELSSCHYNSNLCQPTMRKNSPQNHTNKGIDKPLSPRLTLRFQSIRARDEKICGGSKANDINSSHSKYQSYCVTMETKSDIYEFRKEDGSVSSTQCSTSVSDCDLYDPKLDLVTSSSTQEIDNNTAFLKDKRRVTDEANNVELVNRTEKADSSDSSRINSGRVSTDCSIREYDCASEVEKEENRRKRRKSSDSTTSIRHTLSHVSVQRYHRNQSNRGGHQTEGHSEQRSPKSKKRGSISSSETESNHSEGENEAQERVFSSDPTSLSQNGNSLPHSPKVPPLKIVIPSGTGSLESETRERNKVSSSKQALPYVVNSAAESSEGSCVESSTSNTSQPEITKENIKSEVSSTKLKEDTHPPEERFQRVTRSSHRIQAALAGSSNNNHSTDSTPNSQMVSSSGQKGELSGDSSTDEHNQQQTEVHPRKRKLRQRENATDISQQPSSSSTVLNIEEPQQQTQYLNCYQMFLNIRKQVDKRRRSMCVVHPKPPQGFKDYLLNRCSYVLEGNAASRLNVPMIPPPQSLNGSIKELFIQQEKERYKLRLQHLIEREKLVLSAEQEILRVHGRAARAMANQTVPLSVCSILKDEEIYNVLEFEQDDKDKTVRSRYNGRLFLSWLQDVDDKWEKIKEAMLLRHHNEAESLHAVQKLDWEWKMKELGMCDMKIIPAIDDIYVPMVHVSDDFDLLPA